MTSLEMSFRNYQKMLDLINNNATDNGIAYLNRNYIDEHMNLSRTKTNKIIRDLNEYGTIITRISTDGYTSNCKNIIEITWIRQIIIMIKDTLENPCLLKSSDKYLMDKYNVDRKMVQKYRSYVYGLGHDM